MKSIWYLYIALLLSLGVGRMVERILAQSGGFSSRYLPIIFMLTISVGVYGYINNKPILASWFWKVIFGLTCVLSLSALVYAVVIGLYVGGDVMIWAGLLLLVAVLLIPAMISLQKYSSGDREYW
ncbi:MAG: hypothetical protein OIF38_02215 [Cellvibrionaceae bacterium]|nr:hypothetical protein [Cellvibrionaceae bacterium]